MKSSISWSSTFTLARARLILSLCLNFLNLFWILRAAWCRGSNRSYFTLPISLARFTSSPYSHLTRNPLIAAYSFTIFFSSLAALLSTISFRIIFFFKKAWILFTAFFYFSKIALFRYRVSKCQMQPFFYSLCSFAPPSTIWSKCVKSRLWKIGVLKGKDCFTKIRAALFCQ